MVLAVVGCGFGGELLRVGVVGRELVVVVVVVVVATAGRRVETRVAGVVVLLLLLLLDGKFLLVRVLFVYLGLFCAVVCGVMCTGCCVLTGCVRGRGMKGRSA